MPDKTKAVLKEEAKAAKAKMKEAEEIAKEAEKKAKEESDAKAIAEARAKAKEEELDKLKVLSNKDLAARAIEADTSEVLDVKKVELNKRMKARKALLEARVNSSHTLDAPPETMRAWRRELQIIAMGLWKGPIKIKSKSKLAAEIIG
jgi:hypothetical protein